MSRRDGRFLAMAAIYSWQYDIPDNIVLNFLWLDNEAAPLLENRDDYSGAISFASLIVRGVLKHLDTIDKLIQSNLNNWKLDRLNGIDLSILRIGVFSLLHLASIHPHVVIDEAVKAATLYGNNNSSRFINGVLDAIYRGLKQ